MRVVFRQAFSNDLKFVLTMKTTMQNHISKIRLVAITIGAARGRAARGRP